MGNHIVGAIFPEKDPTGILYLESFQNLIKQPIQDKMVRLILFQSNPRNSLHCLDRWFDNKET